VELQVPQLTPELVRSVHAGGLWAFTKAGSGTAERYKKMLDAGVDAIWISNIASLERFLENYALEE
jgi:hypothetical protein